MKTTARERMRTLIGVSGWAKWAAGVSAVFLSFAVAAQTPADPLPDASDCGNLANAVGPSDYRAPDRPLLHVVETYHFTPEIERLVRGATGQIEDDLSYTLRAFPNHHRALLSMANLGLKRKTEKFTHSPYSIPCWFERAIRFQPEDGNVRLIWGYYLSKRGRHAAAISAMREGMKLGAENANAHYNLGLMLFETKDYEGALEQAKIASQRGFQFDGLKRKLVQAGKWRD